MAFKPVSTQVDFIKQEHQVLILKMEALIKRGILKFRTIMVEIPMN